jgi:hypothetical protein
MLDKLQEIAQQHPGKSPVAVFLGSLGSRKGGRARMDNLTPEERSELGRKAARARWLKKGPPAG